jgi:predicted MPP superfamily phosphohydrolase
MMKKKVFIFFISFICFFFKGSLGRISRGPFLQPTDDLEHTIGIAWETDGRNGGVVNYGLEEVEENQIEGEYQGESPRGKHRYYVKLTALTPGQEYKYQVVSDGEETPVYSFLTSSSAVDFSYRVLVLSDTHFTEDLNDHRRRMAPFLPHMEDFKPHLLLHIGDFPYGGGPRNHATDLEYQNGFTILKEIVARAIFCPVAGNHDLSRPSSSISYDYRIFADEFYLPENGPDSISQERSYLKEANYSFAYGGIHFTTLGVGYLHFGADEAEDYMRNPYQWLETDLERALESGKVRNIITQAHILQPYSTRRGHDPAPRDRYEIRYTNILDKYKVVLALAGHNHSFQRTYPLDHEGSTSSSLGEVVSREKRYYSLSRGVIYQTVSSPYYPYNVSNWSGYAFSSRKLGYLTLEISEGGTRIELKAWESEGRVIDWCVIERNILGGIERKEEKINFRWLYPNPFNPECYIPLRVKGKRQNVKCKIYNILGQLVREIEISTLKSPTPKAIYWDGRDSRGLETPAGMYFYEIAGEEIKRMVVLK